MRHMSRSRSRPEHVQKPKVQKRFWTHVSVSCFGTNRHLNGQYFAWRKIKFMCRIPGDTRTRARKWRREILPRGDGASSARQLQTIQPRRVVGPAASPEHKLQQTAFLVSNKSATLVLVPGNNMSHHHSHACKCRPCDHDCSRNIEMDSQLLQNKI